MRQLVFTCVNEEGETYAEVDNLEDAMEYLNEFPNDKIVVTMREEKES